MHKSALDKPFLVQYSTHMSQMLLVLGERVRRLRSQKGWSQSELARRAGVSRRFLVQIEAGEGNASLLRLSELVQALDCSLVSLLAGLGPVRDDLDVLAERAATLGSQVQQDVLRSLQARGDKIALVGLRGAGKSTIGRRAAERAGCVFVELDRRVAELAGMSLAELFEYHGAEGYRNFAIDALEQVLAQPGRAIIEVGGSLVLDERAMELLQEHSRMIWLRASPEEHLRRVRDQGDSRPMAGRSDALGDLELILSRREPLYGQAECHVDTVQLGIDGAVAAVLN